MPTLPEDSYELDRLLVELMVALEIVAVLIVAPDLPVKASPSTSSIVNERRVSDFMLPGIKDVRVVASLESPKSTSLRWTSWQR